MFITFYSNSHFICLALCLPILILNDFDNSTALISCCKCTSLVLKFPVINTSSDQPNYRLPSTVSAEVRWAWHREHGKFAHTFAEALCDRVETPNIGNGHPTFDSKLGNPCNGYLNLLFVERITVLEPFIAGNHSKYQWFEKISAPSSGFVKGLRVWDYQKSAKSISGSQNIVKGKTHNLIPTFIFEKKDPKIKIEKKKKKLSICWTNNKNTIFHYPPGN